MWDQIKDAAARQVSKVLASDTTMRVLTSPQVKQAFVTVVNFRAEARDLVEKQVKDVAKSLDLVTRQDVAKLRKTVRDLQDHLDELRDQVSEAQAAAAAHQDAPHGQCATATADSAPATDSAQAPVSKPKAAARTRTKAGATTK